MSDANTLSRLFWHRGRRQFVELTVSDAARRLCVTEYQAKQKLMDLSSKGYADHSWHKLNSDSVMIWKASSIGRNLIVAHLDGGIA